jgi:hypothetical protein
VSIILSKSFKHFRKLNRCKDRLGVSIMPLHKLFISWCGGWLFFTIRILITLSIYNSTHVENRTFCKVRWRLVRFSLKKVFADSTHNGINGRFRAASSNHRLKMYKAVHVTVYACMLLTYLGMPLFIPLLTFPPRLALTHLVTGSFAEEGTGEKKKKKKKRNKIGFIFIKNFFFF